MVRFLVLPGLLDWREEGGKEGGRKGRREGGGIRALGINERR